MCASHLALVRLLNPHMRIDDLTLSSFPPWLCSVCSTEMSLQDCPKRRSAMPQCSATYWWSPTRCSVMSMDVLEINYHALT